MLQGHNEQECRVLHPELKQVQLENEEKNVNDHNGKVETTTLREQAGRNTYQMITPLKHFYKKGMIRCMLIIKILLQCLKHKELISKGKDLRIKCPPKNGYSDHSIAWKSETSNTTNKQNIQYCR